MLQSLVAGLLLLPLLISLVTALMRSRPSRATESARSVRGCSLSAANTPVVQLSQTEGDLRTSQDFTNVDTIIASRGEHDSERRTTHVSQRKPVTKPNDGSGLTSSGPRPLILGTFQITTPRSNASPGSRPHSSSSRAPRSPTAASARWSSNTSPLTPRSQLPSSPVSDEVESLKAQLAASDALVKQLTKEKFEAVDASRKLFADVESLQKEHTQWMQEREVLMAKLGLLDEVEVTPGLLPSSEEVWFAGSNQTPPQRQPPLLSPIAISPDYRSPETLPSETHQVPEVAVSQPAATPMAPYLPAIDPASSSLAYLSPPRANRRSRMCRDAVDGSQFGQPAASNRAYSEPLVSEVATIDDDILARIGSAFLTLTPVDNHEGCDPGNTQPPATTPYPHSLLNTLGLFCAPESQVEVLIPPSARSLSAPAQALRPHPDLVDLVSQRVGSDSYPGHLGHRDLDNRAKSFLKEVKASAGSRPSINLTTGLDSRAATTRVSNSAGRQRVASASTKWLAMKESQIHLASVDSLRESASKIDGERQTSRSRFTADKGSATRVGSKSKRPSPLRARNFKPCSSPLANPPITNPYENPEEEQTGTEINGLSNSPLANPPENAKQGHSKKRKQLGKLLKKARSWISRSA